MVVDIGYKRCRISPNPCEFLILTPDKFLPENKMFFHVGSKLPSYGAHLTIFWTTILKNYHEVSLGFQHGFETVDDV
jgi:hypothetical protein